MPQFSAIDKYNWATTGYSGVRETTQGNIVINGVYYNSRTLETTGQIETNAVFSNLASVLPGPSNGTNTRGVFSAPPMVMQTGIQNHNILIGQCHWYASGFGQLKLSLNDTATGYSYHAASTDGGENVGHGFHSGASPGFGIIKHIGSYNAALIAWYAGTAVVVSKNSNDTLVSSARYGEYGPAATATPTLTGYIPGWININGVTKYIWKLPTTSSATTGQSQGTNWGGYSLNAAIGLALISGASLLADTTSPTYYAPGTNATASSTAFTAGLIANRGTIYAGGAGQTSAYRHFIYATSVDVYFVQLSQSSMAGPLSSNSLWLLRKMTFGGVETTIQSINNAAHGYILPTSVYGITATSANVIYPVFLPATHASGANVASLTFRKMAINTVTSSETITVLTHTGATGTAQANIAANVFYNQTGIFGAVAGTGATNPIGAYTNSNDWRYQSTFRTWLATGVSGQQYLNLSYEHTFYLFGTYPTSDATGRAMTTPVATVLNTVNPTNALLKTGNAFSILSYTLDSGETTATFQANTDMSMHAPRWYMPTTPGGLTQWVSRAAQINDAIFRFNESTYIWELQTQMNYRADQVGVDSYGRVWATSSMVNGVQLSPFAGAASVVGSDQIFLEGANLPVSATALLAASSYVYSGTTINTSFTLNVSNYAGSLVASNVYVQLTGGLRFTDGSMERYITTTNSSVTTTDIDVVNGNTSRINTTIVQVL